MGSKQRYVIVACARWENRYIVEWLNYYRAIGFDHVYLYCNDDDPAPLFGVVLPFTQGENPFVTFRYHPHQGEQSEMYGHFLRHNLDDAVWVSFFDIDEFLRLPPTETIGDFMRRFGPEVDCVLFNWVFFGPNGHKEPPDGPVLEAFTAREDRIHILTKFICRAPVLNAPKLFVPETAHAFWHCLDGYLDRGIHQVNVLGESMPNYLGMPSDARAAFWNDPERKARILETAIIHHYAFRSERAFWERAERGLGGSFHGQTVWREEAEGPNFPALLASMNLVADTRLADFWTKRQRAGMESNPAPRLGIAITTFNRRDMVLELVKALRRLTRTPFVLVICDDGSSDGTVEALRQHGETVIAGPNLGIARNKNRGLYYLTAIQPVETVILMDDDVMPEVSGWEEEWIAAVRQYGHMNHSHPCLERPVAGEGSAASPNLSPALSGRVLAFDRKVLAQIGYMDPRFGSYGHEHTDFTLRAIRAGYGGVTLHEARGERTLFYDIEGGVKSLLIRGVGTEEKIQANGEVFNRVRDDVVYRHAWRGDEEMAQFLDEIATALPAAERARLRPANHFASLGECLTALGLPPPMPLDLISHRKPATQSSVSEFSRAPTCEQDAARAVDGVLDGSRKFHTALEDAPWWQVDLGGIATIREIRIHNTTDHTADRFRNFTLGVSIDGESWVEIAAKGDDVPVTAPYVWDGPGTAWARFVRVTLRGPGFLHLAQVEVFGALP